MTVAGRASGAAYLAAALVLVVVVSAVETHWLGGSGGEEEWRWDSTPDERRVAQRLEAEDATAETALLEVGSRARGENPPAERPSHGMRRVKKKRCMWCQSFFNGTLLNRIRARRRRQIDVETRRVAVLEQDRYDDLKFNQLHKSLERAAPLFEVRGEPKASPPSGDEEDVAEGSEFRTMGPFRLCMNEDAAIMFELIADGAFGDYGLITNCTDAKPQT
jgi:hypothetical protein